MIGVRGCCRLAHFAAKCLTTIAAVSSVGSVANLRHQATAQAGRLCASKGVRPAQGDRGRAKRDPDPPRSGKARSRHPAGSRHDGKTSQRFSHSLSLRPATYAEPQRVETLREVTPPPRTTAKAKATRWCSTPFRSLEEAVRSGGRLPAAARDEAPCPVTSVVRVPRGTHDFLETQRTRRRRFDRRVCGTPVELEPARRDRPPHTDGASSRSLSRAAGTARRSRSKRTVSRPRLGSAETPGQRLPVPEEPLARR